MKLNFFALLLLLFLSYNVASLQGCHEDERIALLSFKSLLTDPSGRLSSWHGRNCCSWHGIRCSDDSFHVISVNLRNPNPSAFVRRENYEVVDTANSKATSINGTISSSLFTLAYIRELDLSFNDFQFSKIPLGFANLTSLRYLNLSNSKFDDSITTQFMNLTSLISLDLSCTSSTTDFSSISVNFSSLSVSVGSVSSYVSDSYVSSTNLDWLRGLNKLRVLRLSGVDLSKASRISSWAQPISLLSELRVLHLSNCQISGIVPIDQFLNLTNISVLLMDFNFLPSLIPVQLVNLSSISVLDLSGSHLQGSSLPYLPQLQQLYVSDNHDLTIDLTSMFASPWPRLQYLSVSSTDTIGPIPTSITNTTSLVYFEAGGCSLQGPLPPSISNLSKLQHLNLNDNSITGHLSSSLSNLKSLRFLSLSTNDIGGSIPESICEISSLSYLNLGSNNFSERIPDCIGQLPNLEYFSILLNNMHGMVSSLVSLFRNSNPNTIAMGLSGVTVKIDQQQPFPENFQPRILELRSCNIGGSIPTFFSNLTQLVYLGLADNNLSGTIPFWLFTLPKLALLDLSFNNLQGTLPSSIQLHSYHYPPTALNVANNHLQGSIPLLPENIEVIDLSENNFTGQIPSYIGELEKLGFLSFSGNKLFGQIPPTFCPANNIFLKQLDLSNNSLSGTLPSSLGNCKSLVSLNLGRNNLIGNIPSELCSVKKLSFLVLNDNFLEGIFPNVIHHLESLEFLNLGNNRFEGKLPKFIGELPNLRALVLRSNSFNESIPKEIFRLEKLQVIDLSNNNLFGPIPLSIGSMKMLTSRPKEFEILGYTVAFIYIGVKLEMVSKKIINRYSAFFNYISGIDLSGNSLTGRIPSEIGLLQGLYMLNLSRNTLSGKIPTSIGEKMTGLESLDLSFNYLSGMIPATMTLLDALSTINFSHNNLSGRIPTGMHFDTLFGDGSAYIGNRFLCVVPDGKLCNNSIYSNPKMSEVEDEDANEKWVFYAIVAVGYGVGFWGLFGVLYLVKKKWWKAYWRIIDKFALRIARWK